MCQWTRQGVQGLIFGLRVIVYKRVDFPGHRHRPDWNAVHWLNNSNRR